MYLEGHDQHSRWFVCSLISSMASSQQAPFAQLKTHGFLLDHQTGKKMSKSSSNIVDPDDLIKGTLKLDGTRKFGYGTDVIRLWAAYNDTDRNLVLQQDQLDSLNTTLKLFRQLMK